MSPKAVLVGLPATGKTTTGRRLAKILAVPFADSDELVETATGRRVTEIFAAEGESAFRELEAAAVAEALDGFHGVLALGGGALGHAGTRAALTASGVPVVLLEAAASTLTTRVGDGASRPLLAGDPGSRLDTLAAERSAVYRAAATLTVQTDDRAPAHVAARIAARLHDLEVKR